MKWYYSILLDICVHVCCCNNDLKKGLSLCYMSYLHFPYYQMCFSLLDLMMKDHISFYHHIASIFHSSVVYHQWLFIVFIYSLKTAITEILLKVALNTITITPCSIKWNHSWQEMVLGIRRFWLEIEIYLPWKGEESMGA